MHPKNKVISINGAAFILSDNKSTAEARARRHFGKGVTIGSVSKMGTLYRIRVRKRKRKKRR